MTRARAKWMLACGVAMLLAGGGVLYWARSGPRHAFTAALPQPVPVIAVKVRKHDVPIFLTGLGTVTALNSATVRSQVTGLLISVDFREGQSVNKGELLAQIDPRTYQAQLDQAQAALEHDRVHLKNAQLNLQRYSELGKADSIARQQVDNQQAAVDELEAQIKIDAAAVENAKAQLSYTSLLAPFDGITGIRLVDVGNIIHPPTGSATTQLTAGAAANALVVVTQIQPISVIFTLAATDIPTVLNAMANGSPQAFALGQDDKTRLDTGQLAVVNNQADPVSGTVQLKAMFPNKERKLWPGTFVNVRLVTSTERDALTVPLDAIQQGPQGSFVFVVGPDNRVAVRPVSVGQTFGAEALITHGLSAEESVVVRGQYRLSPGTLVVLADADKPDAVPNPSTAASGMLP
jgi:multidrug efflux system membrane fusion protein